MTNRVCEKCIHYDVCLLHEDNFIDDVAKNGFCGKFKNKADVVEVVRCKECKCLMKEIVVEQTPYGFENEKIEFSCQRILDLTGESVDVMLDDFCSYGTPKERSEGDG